LTTVLVTGGAGFIGSHLCDRLLAEGKRAVAVDDLSSGHIANLAEARAYGPQFTFYNVDVRADGLPQIFARHQPEVVIHLAALARGRGGGPPSPAADANVGVMGLVGVLEASAAAGVRKVVFASGSAVYGDGRRFPLKETMLGGARPLTPGAISKRIADDYLRFYRRFRGLDMSTLILGTVYGPRQDPAGGGIVASLVAQMLGGSRPTVHGDGNQTRDLVFVDDTVHALALAADRGSGHTINVGTGVETSVNAAYRLLADITGFAGEPVFAPTPTSEPRRCVLEGEVAERELGWKPWTHLEDGLRETVAYLRSP
jgi:UDP-glucose 4-epimerase